MTVAEGSSPGWPPHRVGRRRTRGYLRYLMFTAIAYACGDKVSAPKEPADVIRISVGQIRAIDPASATTVHVSGGEIGAEYTLVASASADGPVISLQASAEGVIDVIGPPNPTRMAPGVSAIRRAPFGMRSLGVDLHLPTVARQQLTSRVDAVHRTVVSRTQSEPVVPSVGDELTLNVSIDACGPPILHTARVVEVSDHAVFAEDEANPAGGFTTNDYQSIADEYEMLIEPVLGDNFGVPSDIDNNGGRTVVLFTRAVNELTPAGMTSYISSFFYIRDLIPKVGRSSCPGSNEAELLYLMAPDPAGQINGQLWTVPATRRLVGASLAHSGQHLINQSRRLYVTHAPIEDRWLEEAMSDIAEELVFYAASGLGPRHNLSFSDLTATNAISAATSNYQLDNLYRLQAYLSDPEAHAPMMSDDFESGGAAWQFLRYLADRSAVPERTIWNSLVNSSSTGTTNLATVMGFDIAAAERDWVVAQYTDDAGMPVEATLQEPSWNFRSVLAGLPNSLGFSLVPHVLAAPTPLSIRLERGGASYLRFGVAAGQYASIHLTPSNSQATTQYLSLTLVRTK